MLATIASESRLLRLYTKRRWVRYKVRVVGDGYTFREIKDLAKDNPITRRIDQNGLRAVQQRQEPDGWII